MIHVIIVDDELLAGVGIQSLIDGKENIQVDGVFGGPEDAIPFLRENRVDLVITDIEMAEMNGLDFIQVIRSSDLADGVIILSCHDDFSYAQEAISKGTDSYLLKHKITGPKLIAEVKKIYQKTHKEREQKVSEILSENPAWIPAEGEYYTLCVLRFFSSDGGDERKNGPVQGNMMYHLIEQIVQRYQMGTVFQPYDKSPFILFRMSKGQKAEKRNEMIASSLRILLDNVRQYYSGRIVAGLSTEFAEFSLMRRKYEEAVMAAGKCYYEPENTVFFYHAPISEFQDMEFSSDRFLTDEGMPVFKEVLKRYLKQASFCMVSPENMRPRLVQAVSRMLFRVMEQNPYVHRPQEKKELDGRILTTIIQAKNAAELEESLVRELSDFQKVCKESLLQDPLSEILVYIDTHLTDKLTLNDLADIGCMSVPTFTKKFKERTGATLVQYLNERRIQRAKGLLMNKNLSLEQIAEETGFSNANYLVRVFKKVTGQTISDFRN